MKEKVLILGAMQEEITLLLELAKDVKEDNLLNQKIYLCNLFGRECIIANTGIGLVFSSLLTSSILTKYKIDFAIFTGVAGSLNKKLDIGDIVVATDTLEFSFDATVFGYKKGQIPRLDTWSFECSKKLQEKIEKKFFLNKEKFKLYYSRIISSDKFISDKNEKELLGNEFDAMAVDMESSGFSQTCYISKVPFIVIRSISDTLADEAVIEYEKFVHTAIKNNTYILKMLIED